MNGTTYILWKKKNSTLSFLLRMADAKSDTVGLHFIKESDSNFDLSNKMPLGYPGSWGTCENTSTAETPSFIAVE